MNLSRNYNTYLAGMEKGNAEKLFFLQYLDLTIYDVIIDFGCGRGDILKECVKRCNSNCKCYGIDSDDYMRSIAQKNCTPYAVSIESDLCLLDIKQDAKILIIFSSVLHEVEGYWFTIENWLDKHKGATVVIRDMCYDGDLDVIDEQELAKVVRKSNQNILADFISKYGIFGEKDLYHYLLKYTYVDNWELELNENYFSVPWDRITQHVQEVFYDRTYTLEAKKKAVKKDFDIDMKFSTHRQMIVVW